VLIYRNPFSNYQLLMPAHDSVGFHYIGYFLKGLSTEAMSNFSDCH